MKKTVKLGVAAIGVVIVIVLTGCTPTGTTATPRHARVSTAPQSAASTPSPAPISKPTAAPTSRPVETAAPQAPVTADPWVIGYDGIGPYGLAEDSTAALISAGFTKSVSLGCIDLYTWESGDARKTHKQEFDVTIGVQAGKTVYTYTTGISDDGGLTPTPGFPHTDTGLRFGDGMDKVRSLYPGLAKDVDYGGYREYVTGPVDGHYLRISTTGSLRPEETVWGLRATTYPGVSIPGC